MMCEPLAKTSEELSAEEKFDEIIYLTPDGDRLNQKTANTLSLKKDCWWSGQGHYKGIDERIRQQFVTKKYLLAIMCWVAVNCLLLFLLILSEIAARRIEWWKRLPLQFASRTTCSHRLFIRPVDFRDGKYRTFSWAATIRKLKTGGMNNHWKEQTHQAGSAVR